MSYWEQITTNPRFWLSAAALGSVVAIECWFALWAATATPPARLARVAIVWLAIVILIPIQAEVPALWFTMVAALTMLLVSASEESIANELALRGLQWKLAVELVRSDTGRPPLALAEIVPGILPAMPLDPYSQQPLLLLRTPKGELIPYSVGHDGIDNGGNFTTDAGTYYRQAGFDLKLPVP